MIIIAVWCPKGGVGKSTISINLASALCSKGHRVLVCDLDHKQYTCYDLYKKGNVKWDCVTQLPKDKPSHDFVIIDHPPGHEKVPVGAFVLLPFAPSAIDFKAMKKSVALLAGKKYIPIVNQVDYRNKEDREAAPIFINQGAYLIKRRTAYRTSYGEDKSVFEIGRSYGGPEARKEMNNLVELITNG